MMYKFQAETVCYDVRGTEWNVTIVAESSLDGWHVYFIHSDPKRTGVRKYTCLSFDHMTAVLAQLGYKGLLWKLA